MSGSVLQNDESASEVTIINIPNLGLPEIPAINMMTWGCFTIGFTVFSRFVCFLFGGTGSIFNQLSVLSRILNSFELGVSENDHGSMGISGS